MSLVTIFTNYVSLYSGTYLGSLYSYPILFIRQYMQNQSDRKKNKQLYNEMHLRKRYGNNFYNITKRVTAITFNFSLRHFPCYFRFTCRSDFAVSLTDSVSETMFFFYKLFIRYLIRYINLHWCSKNLHYRMAEFCATFIQALSSLFF